MIRTLHQIRKRVMKTSRLHLKNFVEYHDDNKTPESNNGDGVGRPTERKKSKEKKRKLRDENGVVDALSKLQSTLAKQISINEKTLEMRTKIEEENIQLKRQALNREMEKKMKEQRRKCQERVMNQDLSKLTPVARASYEAMQAKILKEWENDEIFKTDMANSQEFEAEYGDNTAKDLLRFCVLLGTKQVVDTHEYKLNRTGSLAKRCTPDLGQD
ncbi:serine/threonine-protein phosphatase 4 regulatory subunit 4 [Striga asiatica]|uniref:Serine/threonine-protein phosphatase 4 regulatory subunit 4 n=1 Tax=Striga asiatica TaxID=4170 RepID=A0A5A7PYQ0_STRAF|nr:serine/threonine-protein phosphatase 4 regulatory subunit 4 [Striga asiatica]